jgi:hypothetical protein
MRIVSQDPTSNDRKSVRCPPRFDIASFINGNGVKLNQHPSYNMPVPYTFTERLGTELPELTQQLTELSGLLSTLNDLTQQTAPEWPRGHDTL